jgi:hypothetical protein
VKVIDKGETDGWGGDVSRHEYAGKKKATLFVEGNTDYSCAWTLWVDKKNPWTHIPTDSRFTNCLWDWRDLKCTDILLLSTSPCHVPGYSHPHIWTTCTIDGMEKRAYYYLRLFQA